VQLQLQQRLSRDVFSTRIFTILNRLRLNYTQVHTTIVSGRIVFADTKLMDAKGKKLVRHLYNCNSVKHLYRLTAVDKREKVRIIWLQSFLEVQSLSNLSKVYCRSP